MVLSAIAALHEIISLDAHDSLKCLHPFAALLIQIAVKRYRQRLLTIQRAWRTALAVRSMQQSVSCNLGPEPMADIFVP